MDNLVIIDYYYIHVKLCQVDKDRKLDSYFFSLSIMYYVHLQLALRRYIKKQNSDIVFFILYTVGMHPPTRLARVCRYMRPALS